MTPGLAQRILGLSGPPADDAALRRAWRRFALSHHPDHSPDDAAAPERFQLGRQAYEVLRERLATRRPVEGFVPLAAAVPRATREWLA
jgi:hypothetical protein